MAETGAAPSILDSYVLDTPSAQAAVDIFKSEWSSRFPASLGVDSGGQSALFEDARIDWFRSRLGSFQGMHVLELGPLEGGHSYMLQQAGAASVVSIEANTRAYLKCLITKQILNLDRVNFLLGDFIKFMAATDRMFDVGLASGVIYHMKNPAELIAHISRRCRDLFVWTHYYDEDRARSNPDLGRMFSEPEEVEFDGFRHVLVKKSYGSALGWAGFCGGSAEFAHWMPRKDLLACFEHFGMKVRAIEFDQVDHPNGAALALHAQRVDY